MSAERIRRTARGPMDSLELSHRIFPEAVVEFIELHGGSFMRAIAAAWRVADPQNRAKIEATWAAEWAKYRAAMDGEKRRRSIIEADSMADLLDAMGAMCDDDSELPERGDIEAFAKWHHKIEA